MPVTVAVLVCLSSLPKRQPHTNSGSNSCLLHYLADKHLPRTGKIDINIKSGSPSSLLVCCFCTNFNACLIYTIIYLSADTILQISLRRGDPWLNTIAIHNYV